MQQSFTEETTSLVQKHFDRYFGKCRISKWSTDVFSLNQKYKPQVVNSWMFNSWASKPNIYHQEIFINHRFTDGCTG